MSANSDRSSARPINWAVTATVFFVGSVLLWADRSNFSVAAAAWAREYGWTPSTIGTMLSAFSLGYLILQPVGVTIIILLELIVLFEEMHEREIASQCKRAQRLVSRPAKDAQ